MSRSAGKPPQVHPHGQVVALDKAGTDVRFVRTPANRNWNGPNDLTGLVPVGSLHLSGSIKLCKLREVHIIAKVFLDGRDIRLEAISSDLEPEQAGNPRTQVSDELVSIKGLALAHMVREHQLCFGVQGNPSVDVSPIGRVTGPKVSTLGMQKIPEFIGLDLARAHFLDVDIKDTAALLGNCVHQRENRILVYVRQAGNGSHAHAFHHQRNHLNRLRKFQVVTA